MTSRLVKVGRAVASAIDRTDVVLAAGLVLLGAGLWAVSPALALSAVGAIVVWIALPPRPPFLQR